MLVVFCMAKIVCNYMKKEPKHIQHGDISFKPISELPKGLKKIDHNGTFVVALGELTGHCHRVITKEKENLDIFQDEQGRYYFSVKGKVEVEHWNTISNSPAEHKTLPFELGVNYVQDNEEDYNPFTELISKTQD